jgi:hypothetical protein
MDGDAAQPVRFGAATAVFEPEAILTVSSD